MAESSNYAMRVGREYGGIVGLPGFVESLRLLVQREQYSLTDIGLMFGVTRERARQLVTANAIEYPAGTIRGLMARRVWDDEAGRFRPVGRGDLRRQAHRKRVAHNRRARAVQVAERRTRIMAASAELWTKLGRMPTDAEICVAIGVEYGASPTMTLLSRWGMESHSDPARTKITLAAMRKATGRPVERAGHYLSGKRRGPAKATQCRRGHPYPESRMPSGGCRPCSAIRKAASSRRPQTGNDNG